MMPRSLSIRVRLTFWYAFTLILILLLVSVVVLLLLRTTLTNQLENRLQRDLDQVVGAVREDLEEEDLFDELEELEEHGTRGPFFVRCEATEPETYASRLWRIHDLGRALDSGRGDSLTWFWSSPDGREFCFLKKTFSYAGVKTTVVAAADLRPVSESLLTLTRVLLLAGPVAVFLAVLGGYVMAGRLLSPISMMTRQARDITARTIHKRLPVVNPDDELGQLAIVFNETLDRIEDAFKRLRRFTSDASHELRTPLTAVRSVGEVAMRGDLDESAYKEVIGSMLEEVRCLTDLVENLLLLTRVDEGRVKPNRKSFRLDNLVKDVVDHLSVLSEEKGQDLLFENREEIWGYGDPSLIRQAVMNVLDNAIKFTPEGGRIRIRLAVDSPWEVSLEISDSGPGIPTEYSGKVFERFFRLDEGRSRTRGGAGLGLAIAKWSVESEGGRIELVDRNKRGATFRIVLPKGKGGETA